MVAGLAGATIDDLLEGLKLVSCMFCKGWGHKAKFCRTLFNMNKAVINIPTLKNAWGKKKSVYL